ncbi:MAG TPA: branched-chain amino acid ABC transporter permease [Anaerolineae bacterium]|mgnify:CR=1 FL=1|nr:branched-chain amino acid ABC transporter permease [Anaerolineae bacterium]
MLLIGQALISGLLLGGLYAILAIGLSLTWGMLKVINLAHFTFAFLAAYITYQLSTSFGIDPYLTLFVTVPLFFVMGLGLQWCFNRFDVSEFNSLLVSFGLFIILQAVMSALWTADYRRIDYEINPYAQASFWVGPFALPIPQFSSFIAAIVLAGLTIYVLNSTYAGKALRAISQDPGMAAAFGVDYKKMSMLLMGVSTAYAAVAGVFIAMIFALFPEAGVEWIGVVFAVVILGGLANVPGALGAGLLIGLVQALTTAIANPGMAPLVTFSLLIAALLFKPEGLFTRRSTL